MVFPKILSKYLFYLSALLLVPLSLASFYLIFPELHPQPHSALAFLLTFVVCLGLASSLRWMGRKAKDPLYRRESILLVVLIWIITSVISSLPFTFSGTLNPLDAYFEAMSGLTTTGATMLCPKAYEPATGAEVPIHLTNPHVPEKTYIYYGTVAPIRDLETGLVLHSGIEAVSKALLLWRSLLQWIGGMGIVVVFLAVEGAVARAARQLRRGIDPARSGALYRDGLCLEQAHRR